MISTAPDAAWRVASRANLAIRSLLRQKKAESALARFLDDYAALTGRSALEWQLAELIGTGTGAVRAPEAWPESMLARPSGAALAFVIAQRSRTGCAAPRALFGRVVLPRGMRRILARAWAEHPSCDALRDGDDRRAFVGQLIAADAAIEPVLQALLQLDERELARDVAEEWLRHPRAVERTAVGTLERMAQCAPLAEACRSAAVMRIAAGRHNGEELVHLAQILAMLDDHDGVVAVSETARAAGLGSASLVRLLALRLGALEEIDAAEKTVDEYRHEWMPLGVAYPAPEQLLYTLHVAGAGDAVEHLLIAPPQSSPRWIELWSRRVATGRVEAKDIVEWQKLYASDEKKDGRLLVGLTEAILAASDATRAQERPVADSVRATWKELRKHDGFRALAGAYLVLLQENDPDTRSTFEQFLGGEPLSTHAVRRAAVAYVRALSRMREWAKLREFLNAVPTADLQLAFGAHERETHELMARLQELPSAGDGTVEDWLSGWERLLALPLDGHGVSDVVGHFVRASAELRSAGSDVLADERFEDVRLQVQRRGCAEAERLLLAGHLSHDDVAETRVRLATAELPVVREIIDELRIRVG